MHVCICGRQFIIQVMRQRPTEMQYKHRGKENVILDSKIRGLYITPCQIHTARTDRGEIQSVLLSEHSIFCKSKCS